ncbi:S-adenosyl-L-methionine-dependent methyltransferase [Thozetella sp. PMI_491]|nr:S-adenosyl-L-methionine-dependent methyltransferase [Thozetella sp. PMI_491]
MASEPPKQEIGRLEQTFQGSDVSSHGSKWDGLWKESYTPWDRGGPSLALLDLVVEQTELVPPPQEPGKRRTALVPGCGRGYDVLLLSGLGYDVYGLDYSKDAVEKAVENQREIGGQDLYQARQGVQNGTVTWLTGDFFADAFLDEAGVRNFDLIFDYTFFCALPPAARPKWAKRMSQLLNPNGGRLVCLEWPLGKPASTNGPPWGVTAESYEAHLSCPGEEVLYGPDGKPSLKEPVAGALSRLARIKPARTHKAGTDEGGNVFDFISVWSH